jgi:hypothetical protein
VGDSCSKLGRGSLWVVSGGGVLCAGAVISSSTPDSLRGLLSVWHPVVLRITTATAARRTQHISSYFKSADDGLSSRVDLSVARE